jgi:hypothetical protein
LSLFNQYWAAQSPDVDAYMIDVIWPGIAAPRAVDLKKYFKEDEISQFFFPPIIEYNTVDGQLVAMPLLTDAGILYWILYYRTDLLQKYGFKDPPETWKELGYGQKNNLRWKNEGEFGFAPREGRIGGRRPKLSPQQQAEIRRMVSRGDKTAADAAPKLPQNHIPSLTRTPAISDLFVVKTFW